MSGHDGARGCPGSVSEAVVLAATAPALFHAVHERGTAVGGADGASCRSGRRR
jgi:hypothetical protein